MNILETCEKDAIEQFKSLGIDISTKELREKLTPEQKQQVLSFLIQKYYEYNGRRTVVFF